MSVVELDFFAMENQSAAAATDSTLFRRQRSLKDIQSAISKINPAILKSLIVGSAADHPSDFTIPIGTSQKLPSPTPSRNPDGVQNLPTTILPVYSASKSRLNLEMDSDDKYPLTIFYNETVAVFHVSRDEAESILTFAEKGKSTVEIPSTQHQQLLDVDPQDEDLPLARKKSLQRFLENRKER